MLSEVSTLHKKLLDPWSAITVSKVLSSSSSVLDEVRLTFSNFEKKVNIVTPIVVSINTTTTITITIVTAITIVIMIRLKCVYY